MKMDCRAGAARALVEFGRLCGLLFVMLGFACTDQDVGAPCNHGANLIPTEPVATFPAVACNDLFCVYADSAVPPEISCQTDADCNIVSGGQKFACLEGACELSQTHVLDRSMCSRRCGSNSDCEGVRDTRCSNGFECARIFGLGDWCCEKMCVCRDNLDVAKADSLEATCSAGTTAGCCDRDPAPTACGAP